MKDQPHRQLGECQQQCLRQGNAAYSVRKNRPDLLRNHTLALKNRKPWRAAHLSVPQSLLPASLTLWGCPCALQSELGLRTTISRISTHTTEIENSPAGASVLVRRL